MPASIACCTACGSKIAEGGDVVEPLAQDLGEHAVVSIVPPEAAVVVVVEQEHRAVARRGGVMRLGARHDSSSGSSL